MNTQTLLADPAAIRLEKIISEPDSLMLVVAATHRCAECPKCGAASKRIHSRYTRTVADLPCQGIAVRLQRAHAPLQLHEHSLRAAHILRTAAFGRRPLRAADNASHRRARTHRLLFRWQTRRAALTRTRNADESAYPASDLPPL